MASPIICRSNGSISFVLSSGLLHDGAVDPKQNSGDDSHHDAGDDHDRMKRHRLLPAGAEEIFARQAVSRGVSLKNSGQEQRRQQRRTATAKNMAGPVSNRVIGPNSGRA